MRERNYNRAIETINDINAPFSDVQKRWAANTMEQIKNQMPKEYQGHKLKEVNSSFPQPVKLERSLIVNAIKIRMVYSNEDQSIIVTVMVNPVHPLIDELAFTSFKSSRYEQHPDFLWKTKSSWCWRPKILMPIQANLEPQDASIVEETTILEGFWGSWRLEEETGKYAKLTLEYQEKNIRSRVYGVWYIVVGGDIDANHRFAEVINQSIEDCFHVQ